MIKDLWYIVNSIKQDLGIDSNNHDVQLLKWATWGFKDLGLANVMQGSSIMTDRIPVITHPITKEKYINMPEGFMDYYKISICYRGYIVNLNANDNICIAPPKLNCCGEELAQQIDQQADKWDEEQGGNLVNSGAWYGYWSYFPYFKNGQFVAGMYGRGEGGYVAGFKLDWQTRRIVFDRYLKHDEIILEWKFNGISERGNAIVPDGYEGALTEYVHWKRALYSKDPYEHRDFPEHKRQYQRQVKRLIARKMAMTIVEVLDIYRSSIHQAVKR